MSASDLKAFVNGLPKAELHLHLCGSLEPEMMFAFAERNGVKLPYPDLQALRRAYRFDNLEGFLAVYFEGTRVVQTERDFYELTAAYLRKAHSQAVLHTEFSIDPQTFTRRGMPMAAVMDPIFRAMDDVAAETGISARLVLDFIRDYDEDSALETLKAAEPWYDRLISIGLGATEIGNPPAKFRRVYALARELGLRTAAHAGEEGPPEYVREAVEVLGVERIDHGIRTLEDDDLVVMLAERQIPFTLCPLSNQALQVTPDLGKYPIREMLRRGLLITVNSDDPAYFGGYVNENYLALAEALDLSTGILAGLARNSFKASFLPPHEKQAFINRVEAWYRSWQQAYPAT